MTIRKTAAAKSAKPAAKSEASASALSSATLAKAKLTVSLKRRLANGDEIFLAPGIEMDCTSDTLDATQAEVATRVNAWMETLLEAYPEPSLDDDEEDEETEDEEAEDEEEEAEEDEEEEVEVSEEEIAKMPLKELKELIKEAGLDIDPKGMKLADLREAVTEALFGDEDEEGDEEDEEEDEEGDEEEGDEDELSEEDLRAMKLNELQELCEEWGIGEPKIKKGTSLKDKKELYVQHIMEHSEEE